MKEKFLTSVLFFTFVGFIAITPALAKISDSGSPHNFSAASWNTNKEICVVCHTPHNAQTGSYAPLWNHATSIATYTVYSSSTLNATGLSDQAGKLCLSCHDGTVGIDAYGGRGGTTFVTGGALLGTDLSNDHPIGFNYDTQLAQADGYLFDPSSKIAFGGKTIKDGMLYGNYLDCGSCHDVHETRGASSTSPSLLVIDNTGSALCLTCHNK